MLPRVYDIAFTVPAGTPQSSPVSVTWHTEDNVIDDIELEIPPGHNGLTGIRVMKGDSQLLPFSTGTFIVANDYSRVFPMHLYMPTSDIILQGFNNGAYPHTFYLRMTISDYVPPSPVGTGQTASTVAAGSVTLSPDPLSPDALLGADTAAAITSGNLIAADVAPIDASDLTVPPVPAPTGLT
jgi:hypothetical protein